MDDLEWEGRTDPDPALGVFAGLIYGEISLCVGGGNVGEGDRVKALQHIGC